MKISGAAAQVATALLEGGPATASGLAEQLGLTATAVRRQLDSLESEGLVEHGERAPFGPTRVRGRGRPARVYSLTAAGRDAFDQAYDDVAVGALRFLAERGGDDAVLDFARSRVDEVEGRYRRRLAHLTDTAARAERLAELLTADGYAATVTPTSGPSGVQVCQHHCPVAHVAAEFPQFCEAETEAFSRLLGRHVTRLATLAHGDGVCTTHLPTAGDHADAVPVAAPFVRAAGRTPA